MLPISCIAIFIQKMLPEIVAIAIQKMSPKIVAIAIQKMLHHYKSMST